MSPEWAMNTRALACVTRAREPRVPGPDRLEEAGTRLRSEHDPLMMETWVHHDTQSQTMNLRTASSPRLLVVPRLFGCQLDMVGNACYYSI